MIAVKRGMGGRRRSRTYPAPSANRTAAIKHAVAVNMPKYWYEPKNMTSGPRSSAIRTRCDVLPALLMKPPSAPWQKLPPERSGDHLRLPPLQYRARAIQTGPRGRREFRLLQCHRALS